MKENDILSPEEIYKKASHDVLKLISKVLNVEKEYLTQKSPHGVNAEIVKIFKQEIKE